MMMDARTAARLLGGTVVGRDRVVCPGPGHSAADRSLSVKLDPSAPGGILVTSHAGDDWRVCKDFVDERFGIRHERRRRQVARPAARMLVAPDPSEAERSSIALKLWSEATDIPCTPAEVYLRGRGVWDVLPDGALGEALRWHRGGYMVALVRDIVTDAPKAIHRTFIDASGRKVKHLVAGQLQDRAGLGPLGGGAVKLTDNADVTAGLGIGEGIETTLSLRRLANLENLSVCSLLSAGQVGQFPVLPGIEGLWIAVDHDPAGVRASEATTDRWTSAGRDVLTIAPTMAGADLNDIGGGARVS